TVDAKLIRYFVVECDTGDTATVERIEVLIVGDVAVGRRAEEGRAEEGRAEEVVKNTQEAVVCSRPSVPSNRLRSNERGVERDVDRALRADRGGASPALAGNGMVSGVASLRARQHRGLGSRTRLLGRAACSTRARRSAGRVLS